MFELHCASDGAKLSQADAAQAAGISQPYLAQVENGIRTPSTKVLNKLAQVTNSSVAWFSGEIIQEKTGIYWNDPRLSILKDAQVAPGLRELAEDESMCHVLEVSRDEWITLRSLSMQAPPGKNGYLLLLHALRAVQTT